MNKSIGFLYCCTCHKSFGGWKDGHRVQACCCTECLIEAKKSGVVIDEEGGRAVFNQFTPKPDKFGPAGSRSKKKKKRNVYREVHEKALAFAGVVEREDYYDDE